jgi:glyoxylase-like metal-dependent hydrolase (beta-lactamase superfamily II)
MAASALCLLAGVSIPSGGASQEEGRLDLRPAIAGAKYGLYAVEYARSEAVAISRLMRGSRGGAVDMSWYFFVVVGGGRVALVDVGTDALSRRRSELRSRWSIARATDVSSALSRTGLSPGDVTDVVLTHHHWDHVGALGRFDAATVHAHRGEWRRVPARLRTPVERSDRLATFDEANAEIWPGFAVREAGRHTAHQVMVELACERGPVVIASDAAYLYRNVEEGKPVTVTVDRRANVADVAAAAARVGAANVLPGHDPALFERHPSPVRGVAAICE